MDIQKIRNIRERLDRAKINNYLEENTKQSIINPILNLLGYDTSNPEEVNYEVNAVVDGTIKNEKIDMAVYLNNSSKPTIILEAKAVNVKLDKKHRNQLYRYFSTLNPKVAILTNGEEWWFYTDLNNQNLMDEEPYLKLNLYNDKDLDKYDSYSKKHILNMDIKSDIVNLKAEESVNLFFDDILNLEFSDSFLEYIKKNYDLDAYNIKDKQLRKCLANGVNNFSKKLFDKNNNLINIKKFYEDYEVFDNDYLKNVYVFDKKLECTNYTSLFVNICLALIDKDINNLNKILSSVVWTNTIKVCKGKPENCKDSYRYNSKYDISFISHTDTKMKLLKLIKLFEELDIDVDSVVFEINGEM